jgi:hypothetical protein
MEYDILPIYINSVEDIYKYSNIKKIIIIDDTHGIILLNNYKTWLEISPTCTLKDWILYKIKWKNEYLFDEFLVNTNVFKDIKRKCKGDIKMHILKKDEEYVRIDGKRNSSFIDIKNPPAIYNTKSKVIKKIRINDIVKYSSIKNHI